MVFYIPQFIPSAIAIGISGGAWGGKNIYLTAPIPIAIVTPEGDFKIVPFSILILIKLSVKVVLSYNLSLAHVNSCYSAGSRIFSQLNGRKMMNTSQSSSVNYFFYLLPFTFNDKSA